MLLAATLVACAGLAACEGTEGATPECVDDLTDADGNYVGNQHLENGCNPTAVCVDADGKRQDPTDCCQGLDALATQECLAGFGEGTFPGSTSTTTSATTTGAGGGGGA
jgi:hypothetical protein